MNLSQTNITNTGSCKTPYDRKKFRGTGARKLVQPADAPEPCQNPRQEPFGIQTSQPPQGTKQTKHPIGPELSTSRKIIRSSCRCAWRLTKLKVCKADDTGCTTKYCMQLSPASLHSKGGHVHLTCDGLALPEIIHHWI